MTPSEPLPKDELFAPAGVQFKPIEKSYATAVLLLNAIWWGLVLIAILLICYFSQPPVWVWALAALPVLLMGGGAPSSCMCSLSLTGAAM